MDKETLRTVRRENFKLLIDERFAGRQADLALAAKKNPTQINHWVSGHRNPNGDTCREVEKEIGLPENWLDQETHATANITTPGFTATATGSNQAPALIGRAGRATELIELENNHDYPAIRRVNITAKAGVTGYAVDYIDEDRPPIFFRRDWYDSNGYKPEKMLAMRVAGESMIPSLHPGDLIVVNTAQTQPKQGIAFLVSFEGEVVVKRLVRDDGQWWLTSDNQDQRRYPRVKCNGETEIIGEVVYLQTAVI